MHPHDTPTRLPPRRQRRCSSFKYSRNCHPTAQTTRGGGPGSQSSAIVRGTLSQPRTSARLRRSLGGGGSRLAAGRLARLGATPDVHHGLLAFSHDVVLNAARPASWVRAGSPRPWEAREAWAVRSAAAAP